VGINIIIERPSDYERHPDWDWLRHSGDRDFMTHFKGYLECKECDGFPYEDDRVWYRPKDLAAFRERAASALQPDRWMKAADIMEQSPDYWFHLSY